MSRAGAAPSGITSQAGDQGGSPSRSKFGETEDYKQNFSSLLSADNIIGVAKMIGIDPLREPQFLWICEHALREETPSGEWQETVDDKGQPLYFNIRTKKMQSVHPVIEKYAQVYHKQKSYQKLMQNMAPGEVASAEDEQLSAIISDVMKRVNQKLPPATPDILERLALLPRLQINPATDFFLMRSLKLTLEAYVEKRFNLQTFQTDLEAPFATLREIRKQQVRTDVVKKPTAVIMCQECEDKSAVLKCEQCQDYFCQDCFNATHATGKRRGHITADVEQLVCAACDRSIATSQCIQCGLFYCDQCYASTHAARPELHNHLKRMMNGLVCLECEHYNASVLCEDCLDLYCTECFIKLHRKGQRRQHVHLTIDNTGQVFRGGFQVSQEQAQLLTERARSTTEGGPWMMFKDDALNTYWYHLEQKVTQVNNPYPESVPWHVET